MCMANITLAMPDDVHKRMKRFPEMRWSAVARESIIHRLAALERVNQLASKSKLTQKDIDEFDKLIKRKAAERFRKEWLTQTSSSRH